MTGILTFKNAEVRALAEHAEQAPSRRAGYDELFDPKFHKGGVVKTLDNGWPDQGNLDLALIPAGLFLVHDRGVYLMSNGEPGLLVNPDGENHVVAYAVGLNPDRGDDYWDESRQIMGGDDTVISLSLAMFRDALASDHPIRIRVTEQTIEVLPWALYGDDRHGH